jgi:hypothetical protein
VPVDTTNVTGRRAPRYESLDDVLRDAGRLAGTEVEMLGNWSLGQVFRHLAVAVVGSIDGFSFRLPRLSILVVRLFWKKRLLARGIPPGLGLSRRWESVRPEETPVAEGLALLRAALARFRAETKRSPHPAMGTLTPDEWHRFHLRHAELHLSFAVPKA